VHCLFKRHIYQCLIDRGWIITRNTQEQQIQKQNKTKTNKQTNKQTNKKQRNKQKTDDKKEKNRLLFV